MPKSYPVPVRKARFLGPTGFSGGTADGSGVSRTGGGGNKNVTIKNGTIVGFGVGVSGFNVSNVTLSHLIFKDQTAAAVNMVVSSDVVIENSSFLLPPTTEAIRLGVVDNFMVQNVDIHGGSVGVNVGCNSCDGSEGLTNGTVRNSTFTGTAAAGVNVFNTTDTNIWNNHFSGGRIGISANPVTFSPAPRSGIEIEDNYIHDNIIGIQLGDAVDSNVSRNQVRDNTSFGIRLFTVVFGSTNNEISSNLTSGNGDDVNTFDLFHDAFSSPNVWVNNSCDTKLGDDIPDC